MKKYLVIFIILFPLGTQADTEIGRATIPDDAQDIAMSNFFPVKVTQGPHQSSVPGYDLRISMTSMTEGDCDPTAPSGAAGSCSEPRDVEVDVVFKAVSVKAVPKLSRWSNHVKEAKKLFRLEVLERGPSYTEVIVFLNP